MKDVPPGSHAAETVRRLASDEAEVAVRRLASDEAEVAVRRLASDEAEVAVRRLASDEAEVAVRVLARAFRDNPLNRAVIGRGRARRERVNAAGLRPQLPAALRSGSTLGALAPGAAVAPGRVGGVLVATRPGAHALGTPSWPVRLRALAGQGLRVARRWGEVQDCLLPHRPPAPHWYLALLGVEPDCQRGGLGAALVGAFLAEVDSDGSPVWLETDRAENVGFYERSGFRVERELTIFGVPVWLLQRPVRAAPHAASSRSPLRPGRAR